MTHTRTTTERAQRTLDLALVIPLQGSAGLFGPSCEQCAQLAVEEINAADGILGREVRLTVLDGSLPPARVADEVGALVAAGLVHGVVGWHISAVRQRLAPRIAGQVPYVYTALYEGGERTPGVFLVGETPSRQLLPAMRWLRHEHGVRRWAVVGNDYVWPRASAQAARAYTDLGEAEIVDEHFVPLGTTEFGAAIERIARCDADAVLMLLVGEDAVHFNRAFARAGLDLRCRRLSTLMEENILLGSGWETTRGLFAAAAYFETLATPESLGFGWRYTQRFGAESPTLNSLGESCFEGMLLLGALVQAAGGLDVSAMCRVADTVSYPGPRGELHLRSGHVDQRVYLAEADGLRFDVVAQL